MSATRADWVSQIRNKPSLDAREYNFHAQSPVGTLAAGANTITLSPVPLGVNGTDQNHYLYISGGTGTAEAVLITGGTAVAGASSGTIIVTCANSHSGAWTIQSATGGLSEAISALPSTGGSIELPTATIAIHAPIKRRLNMPIWVRGQGTQATILSVASDFPLSANGVFDWSPGDTPAVPVGGACDLTIQFVQPDSTNVATYTHWPPAVYTTGTYHSEWRNITLIACWDGFAMPAATNGMLVSNLKASYFDRLFNIDGHSYDTVRLENIHATTVGLTANQSTAFLAASTGNVAFYVGSVDDLKISNATIGGPFGFNFHTGTSGTGPSAFLSNIWCEGQYTQSDGDVRIEGFRAAAGGSTPLISHVGGNLVIDGAWLIYFGSASMIVSQPVRADSSTSTGPLFLLSNAYINSSTSAFVIYGSTAGSFTGLHRMGLANSIIVRPTNIVYANGAVLVENGTGETRLLATGLSFGDLGSGSGAAIALTADTWHVVTCCQGGNGAYALAGTTKTVWMGNVNFGGNVNYLRDATKIAAKLSPATFSPLQTENYIANETGANNAIAGALTDAAGANIPLAAGLKVTAKLAHTLQAGANTFALNGGAAVAIKSSRNPANNIATGYASGGTVALLYDGTEWVDLNQ